MGVLGGRERGALARVGAPAGRRERGALAGAEFIIFTLAPLISTSAFPFHNSKPFSNIRAYNGKRNKEF